MIIVFIMYQFEKISDFKYGIELIFYIKLYCMCELNLNQLNNDN